MDANASLICDGLIDHTIKSVVVIGVVLMLCKTLEAKLSAATRKYVLLFTTLVVFLLPVLSRWTSQQTEIRIWTVWSASRQDATQSATADSSVPAVGSAPVVGDSRIGTWLESNGPVKLAAGVWLAGIALLSIRWAYQILSGEWKCHQTRTHATGAHSLQTERVLEQAGMPPCSKPLLASSAYLVPDVSSAVVLGLFRPVVLLPEQFALWPTDQAIPCAAS